MTCFFVDLEAAPPPMTHGEKLAALPDSKYPKLPKAPVRGKVPRGWKDKVKIAARDSALDNALAEDQAVYEAVMGSYNALVDAAAEAHWMDLAKNPLRAEITVIGWAIGDGSVQQHSGPDALAEFIAAVHTWTNAHYNTNSGPFLSSCEWVTYNGNSYDLPLLWRWLAKGGYKSMRDAIPMNYRRSCDLMAIQGGRGQRRYVSLDDTARDYLGERKPGSSNPAADWVSGDLERRAAVLERNKWDVAVLQRLAEIML